MISQTPFYRSLFIQARGVLKKELVQHLRSKRLIRRSVHARAGGESQGQIVDAISIRERPAEIEDRAIPGHWEGDLLAGVIGNNNRSCRKADFAGTKDSSPRLSMSALAILHQSTSERDAAGLTRFLSGCP